MREDQCYKKSETVTTFVNRYDLETKTMTLRLSIRAGAAVGAPPAEPGRWMYSVLQARWVRRAAPVAPPKTLLTEPHVCEGVLAAYCL